MEDDIIALQTKLGYQEQDIRSLSEELYAQQKEIARLKQLMADLAERLHSLENDPGTGDAKDEPPPPHY